MNANMSSVNAITLCCVPVNSNPLMEELNSVFECGFLMGTDN